MKRRKVISEANSLNNEKKFCQLALAIFKNKITFSEIETTVPFDKDDSDSSSSFFGDFLIKINNSNFLISVEFNYSIINKEPKFKGDYERPSDQTEYILDDIEIKKVILTKNDNDFDLSVAYPVDLFAQYITAEVLMKELDEVNSNRYLMKLAKKINSSFNTTEDLSRVNETRVIKDVVKEVISELTQSNEQRYIVTMDFYIYAKDNDAAIKLAQTIVEKEDKKYDNAASLLSVHKQPWGVLGSTLIWGKEK